MINNKKILTGSILLAIILLLIISFIPLIFSSIKISKWSKDSLPYTNELLELLKNDNHVDFKERYRILDGNKIEELSKDWGVIKSYKFKGAHTSQAGFLGKHTGFFMKYKIVFESGKINQATFAISINKQGDIPIKDEISRFSITENFGEKYFYLSLERIRD